MFKSIPQNVQILPIDGSDWPSAKKRTFSF